MKITDDIFKSIFNESVWISITTCTISLKFIPKGPIDYKSALVQVVAWHRTGEKPLPESMLTQFTDAYIGLSTHPGTGVDGASGRGWKLADFLLKHV